MKRIIVLSDGTWASQDSPTPSNIVKLTKMIPEVGSDGVKQAVFYDSGLGTAGGLGDQLAGGAFGVGIDMNIEQMYTFISLNYEEGDEIYMYGYSRGAYTIRSLGGLMYECGLVRKKYVESVDEAYELYREHLPLDDPKLVSFRQKHGERVPITLMCCFDTVGSLGIPDGLGFLSQLDRGRYKFHNTKLSPLIQHALHILSIDEENGVLKPTFMTANDQVKDQLTQLYFWGKHGGVGGSNENEIEQGKVTLKFLVDEMKRRKLSLTFDEQQIPKDIDILEEQQENNGNFLFGVLNFFIGSYTRPVSNIDQMHNSAVKRFQQVSSWRPKALQSIASIILG